MGHKKSVESQRLDDDAALIETLQQLATHFGTSIDTTAQTVTFAHLNRTGKKAPDVSFAGCTLRRAGADGVMPPTDNLAEQLATALRAASDFGGHGRVDLSVAFEEKESKQSRTYHDSVTVSLTRGKRFFCYNHNGSMIAKSPPYAFAAFGKLAAAIGLPLNVAGDKKAYSLEHAQEGKMLERLGGFEGNNPTGFKCEVDWSIDELSSKVPSFLDVFGSGKTFGTSWMVTTPKEEGIAPGDERARAVLEFATSGALPFKKLAVDIDFVLDSLEAVIGLRNQCKQKDSMSTSLFAFEQPNGGVGEVRLRIEASGYTVTMEMADDVDLADVRNKTGVQFG